TAASRGEATPADAMDDALAQLIAEETAGLVDDFGRDGDDAAGGYEGDAAGDTGRDQDDDPTPGDQRPV
ncbi:hypothetical protein ACO1NI_14315, partial [Staphylococcus aureus]